MRRGLKRALLVAVAAAWGCNALLGNEDGAFTDDAGDASVLPDASADDARSREDGARPGDAATDGETGIACTANVMIDPANCGVCGHDCFGGACTNGLCEAVTMVGDAGVLLGFGANEDNAYWTSTLRLMRLPLDGKSAPIEFDDAPDATTASKLVVSSTDVVWTLSPAYKQLQTCPAAGCPDTGPFALPEFASPLPAAVMREGMLYWSDDGTQLRVTPVDGGATEVFADSGVTSIAIEPPYVYWARAKDGGSVAVNNLDKVTAFVRADAKIDTDGDVVVAWRNRGGTTCAAGVGQRKHRGLNDKIVKTIAVQIAPSAVAVRLLTLSGNTTRAREVVLQTRQAQRPVLQFALGFQSTSP
ncbi:MAG: hypothetical protein JWM74_349, partial [Myxococcaceae bacterium]|nr:hypothetical protein [Myxococcaceae bacterium]